MKAILRLAVVFAFALISFAVAAQSGDLIVEKKTFEMPAYTTAASRTICRRWGFSLRSPGKSRTG